MVVPEVQQVTTRSKGKQLEWEVQEAVRKMAKEWVEDDNSNGARMMQENAISTYKANVQPIKQSKPTLTPADKETWKVLADCQVSVPLPRLLKLVPRFMEKVGTLLTQKDETQVSVNYN